MKHYYKGKVEKGKFSLLNRKAFDTSIKHYKDGEYLVTLFRLRNKDQREWQEFYFAVLGNWSDDTGYTKGELHDMVKQELFPDLFETETSTTELTNEQWNILFFNLERFLILKFENR